VSMEVFNLFVLCANHVRATTKGTVASFWEGTV